MTPLVLHIPHASRTIPTEERHRYLPDEQRLAEELLRMTDAWTEELVAGVTVPATRIVFPVSRIVIDVERSQLVAKVYRDAEAARAAGAEEPRYLSHFVTCPDRAEWRRT